MNETFTNNQAEISGKVLSEFQYTHQIYDKTFYITYLSVKRQGSYADKIPVMVSEEIIDKSMNYTGRNVFAAGQFRSYISYEAEKHKKTLYFFAKKLSFINDSIFINTIYLDGYICKKPIFRLTPLGREIADLMIAVNRTYRKSDYIPCICWNSHARFASELVVGSHIQSWGRIQSREYEKAISEHKTERKIAYEVSINQIQYADI